MHAAEARAERLPARDGSGGNCSPSETAVRLYLVERCSGCSDGVAPTALVSLEAEEGLAAPLGSGRDELCLLARRSAGSVGLNIGGDTSESVRAAPDHAVERVLARAVDTSKTTRTKILECPCHGAD